MPGADGNHSTVACAPSRRETIGQAGEARSVRIESVRALAALAVLWAHLFGVSTAFENDFSSFGKSLMLGGAYGVFLFFALTGYLLYWPFVRHYFGGNASPDLRRYAINRALRILPLYWVVIAALLAFSANASDAADWWRYAFFLQNWSIDTVGRLDSPIWSLAVEMQFYFLLPLLAVSVAFFSRRSLRAAALLILGLGIGSYALRWVSVTHSSSVDIASPITGPYTITTTFIFFAAGMLLALLRLAWEGRTRRLPGLMGSTDVWLVTAVALWAFSAWRYRIELPLAAGSFLVVGACVLPLQPGLLMRVLEQRLLAALGVASYSLYLWHVGLIPLIADGHLGVSQAGGTAWVGAPQNLFGLLVLGAPLSIGVALISYRLIEAPFLRLRRRWS